MSWLVAGINIGAAFGVAALALTVTHEPVVAVCGLLLTLINPLVLEEPR